MNTHTHLHHDEQNPLREHRLIFEGEGAEAPQPPKTEIAEAPEAETDNAEDPSEDAEGKGAGKVAEADKAVKKEKAAVDTMAEKLGIKMNEGNEAPKTAEEAMKNAKADLLAVLQEQLSGVKMQKPPEAIANHIMAELGKSMKGIPFDAEKPDEYIAKVKAEAERLVRSHPDIIRITSTTDKEKGIESPLTPQELKQAKTLLNNDTLKQMKDFLAKDKPEMQQSLTKLWLGAQGFSVDDSVKEFKPENLTLENTHKVEGMGQLINMAILAFTVINLLKSKTEEIKKTVEDGVKKATGEGGEKPADGKAAEGGSEKKDEGTDISTERKDELLASVKKDGMTKTLENREMAISLRKADVTGRQRTRDTLQTNAKNLESAVQTLEKAPAGETEANKTALETQLAQKKIEFTKAQEELKTAETDLQTSQAELGKLNKESMFLLAEKARFAKSQSDMAVARTESILNLTIMKEQGKAHAGDLADVLRSAQMGFSNDNLIMYFSNASFPEQLKKISTNILGNIPASEDMGIDPASKTVTSPEKHIAFLRTLLQSIEGGKQEKLKIS